MASNESFDLPEGEESLSKHIISTISETAVSYGVSSSEASKLAEAIFDSLESKGLVVDRIEYGRENINSGGVEKTTKDEAEYVRAVSEWTPCDE